jgi:hypothetical protein
MAAPYIPVLMKAERAEKPVFAALMLQQKVQHRQALLHPMLRGKSLF